MKNFNSLIQSRFIAIILVCLGSLILTINNVANAQVSVTATAGTTGPTSYTTVNAALAAITAGTHQGAIIVSITGNTTEPAFAAANQLLASGTGSANYQSVKIVPVGNVTINSAATPTTARAILEFIGADSITIDGDDPSTSGTNNLTIQVATTTLASTACLRFSSSSTTSNGCLNCTVKNCNIIGGRSTSITTTASYGIFCGLSTAAATITTASGSADNDNMLIQNNNITRCYTGIYCYGLVTYYMDNLRILNNTIGSSIAANNIGFRGILVANTQTTATAGPASVLIEGNDIQGGESASGIGTSIGGIDIATGNGGAIIRKNNIHDWYNPSTGGWGCYGITISNVTNNGLIDINNNFIRDIQAYHYTSGFGTYTNYGIYITVALPNLSIRNNTIALLIPNGGSGTINSSACIYLPSATLTLSEFSNNILINKNSDNTGQACVGLYLGASTVASVSAFFNRNDYFVPGVSGYVGRIGATNYVSLASWQAITTKDTNSLNVDPVFTSPTNLHLLTGSKSQLESAGGITSITTDIDGDVRPGPAGSVNGGGTAPDIGADEADLRLDLLGVDSTGVDQITGQVAPGVANQQIIRIRTYLSGSVGTPLSLSSIILNTAGSTSASDISAANVYYTGSSSVFSTATPFGSAVSSPSGSFTVTGTQALSVGVNYLWLAYDISPSAVNTHVVDGRFDSMQISGSYYKSPAGNPAGNVVVALPMTYISSTATQSVISKVEQGSTNNQIIGMQVVTSATGSSINATQFDLSANGSTDTSNIRNIKIWYTGTSSTFAATTQFGSTLANLPGTISFSVSGNTTITNGTNYFWLTYDINAASTATNVVDAEFASIIVGGTSQTPTITAPTGNREIRAPYCLSSASATGDEEILNVTFGTLNNSSTCATVAPGPGSVSELYANYTTSVTAPNILRGGTYPFSMTKGTCGSFYGEVIGVYIDYNQNGILTDAGEDVFISSYATGSANQVISSNIVIPCSASIGTTLMRVVYVEDVSVSPCGTSYGWGETEDYLINIQDNPIAYNFSTAIQQSGTVAPGTIDKTILRIPVLARGCGVATANSFNFNTIGSTSASDIAAAKLYVTGNSSTFNTSRLIGTSYFPNGVFTFSVTDTLVANDTTNYWLAYDISVGAVLTHVVDARLDSLQILGVYRIPATGNPAGNVSINSPMTYTGSTATQSVIGKVAQGSVNNQIIGMQIVTSATGSPINATQFDFSANGTTDTSNIRNIKVWYTGTSNTFSSTTQFGSTLAVLPGTLTFSITGSAALNNGTNYFWLTYDITPTATVSNYVDAEFNFVTVAGTSQLPSVTAPSGNRQIRADYCLPTYASGCGTDYIAQVRLKNLDNSTGCAAGSYTYFNTLTIPNITRGMTDTIVINYASDPNQYGRAWIDWNGDGDFNDPGEDLGIQTPANAGSNGQSIIIFTTPCNADLGNLRLRIRGGDDSQPLSTQSCGAAVSGYGEGEDYMVNILDNPPVYSFATALQQTGTVSPGTTDKSILRIPVKTTGCGVPLATTFKFNTIGSTNVTDISAAKLYVTGNAATFNTTKLLGTVLSPSGVFTFIVNDTLVANDTTNYWLAYDISVGAGLTHVVDARLDSMEIMGGYRIPSIGNPGGNVVINSPMTYLTSVAFQPSVSTVIPATTNNIVLGLRVIGSSSGSPINLTSMDVNTNGTTLLTDITNLKIWYTGNIKTFATTTQFGTTVATPAATHTITGIQPLSNDTNYFWVTYDIASGATLGDSVDAECTSIIVGGSSQTPTQTAPAGNRRIRANYCIPSHAGTNFVTNLQFGNINNSPAAPVSPWYTFFPQSGSTTTSVVRGTNVNLSITYNGTTIGSIWIDFNDDGILAASEWTQLGTSTTSGTFTVSIPCSAVLGDLRMRIRTRGAGNINGAVDACTGFGGGECQDYTITILDNPTAYIFGTSIQQTGLVIPGSIDREILRIPVRANGCGVSTATDFRFNTAGSTSATDITSAKLYSTGNSATFNTSRLIGTAAAPNGVFTFTVLDTLISNDTTNYWLAYDISASATLTHVVDARLDSIQVLGAYRIPTVGNPAGNRTILNPTAPTVARTAPANYGTASATIGGSITFDGGASVTSSGVVFGTSPNPVRLGSGVIDSTTTPVIASGSFTFNVTGLTANTWYYYRAYATNMAGTGYSGQDSFIVSPLISTLPYNQNFDGILNSGWLSQIVGGTINEWVLGTPAKAQLSAAYSAPKCWVTKISGNYSDNQNAAVVSPQFDFTSLSSDPVLSFRHNFITEAGWDGAVIEVSTDGGTNWVRVDSTLGTGTNFNTANSYSWYNNTSTSGPLLPAKWSDNSNLLSSNVSNWLLSQTRLNGTAGQPNVKIRIRFASDGSGNNDGWAFDDVRIVEVTAPSVQASAVTIGTITNTTMNISWTSGNGASRVVVARPTSATSADPVSWKMYNNANSVFGSGDTTIANNFFVYNSTGNSLTVTGLTLLTNYTFSVYEYNGSLMHVVFKTPAATNNATTLPVNMLGFTGNNMNGDVLLKWSTASELNNKGFDIESSIDGMNFRFVKFVEGKGNSSVVQNYVSIDEKAFELNNTNVLYYRLRQIDMDGKFAYTKTVTVRKSDLTVDKVNVYPNPSSGKFFIDILSVNDGNANIIINDARGQEVSNSFLHVTKGSNLNSIDILESAGNGIYFIKVIMNGEAKVIRFSKIN